MKRVLQAMTLVGLAVAVLVLIAVFMSNGGPISTVDNGNDAEPFSDLIDPYEISKNPYLLKGHSGILDTTSFHIVGADGRKYTVRSLSGTLRFEKMIDPYTATYEVLDGRSGLGDLAEIAVKLENSDPPKIGPPWRVIVDGPMTGITALGTSITITAVRFEGYGELPPEPSSALHNDVPLASQEQRTPAEDRSADGGTQEKQEPAPIVRIAPTKSSDELAGPQLP